MTDWSWHCTETDDGATGTLDECCVALVKHEMSYKLGTYRLNLGRYGRSAHCCLVKEVAGDGVRCIITEIGVGVDQEWGTIERAVVGALTRAGAATVVDLREV
jgi:hypothetical protein